MVALSVLSNFPKEQLELRVGQGKQKTHLPTGQVHLNFLFLPYENTDHLEHFHTLSTHRLPCLLAISRRVLCGSGYSILWWGCTDGNLLFSSCSDTMDTSFFIRLSKSVQSQIICNVMFVFCHNRSQANILYPCNHNYSFRCFKC